MMIADKAFDVSAHLFWNYTLQSAFASPVTRCIPNVSANAVDCLIGSCLLDQIVHHDQWRSEKVNRPRRLRDRSGLANS